MRHIVQTGREVEQRDVETGISRMALADKVTIGCASASEAREIAEGMGTIPKRRAFAGVELYTEGGIKIILSYQDLANISYETRELSVITDRLAAY